MKTYNNKQQDSIYLKEVTGCLIQQEQHRINFSPDAHVVATTTIPLTDSNGCTLRRVNTNEPVYDCIIYFESVTQDNRQLDKQTGQVIKQDSGIQNNKTNLRLN